MTEGILYILYDGGGKVRYADEFKKSLLSLRKFCNLPVTLYTDDEKMGNFDKKLHNVNIVKVKEISERLPSQPREDHCHRGYTFLKLFCFKDLPYDVTIYADTDTLFFDDPSKLIAEDYDIAICRESDHGRKLNPRLKGTYNTGFFIAKKNKTYESLIKKAIEIQKNKGGLRGDQRAINTALHYMYDITIKILPQQWNVRPNVKKLIKNHKMAHWHGV